MEITLSTDSFNCEDVQFISSSAHPSAEIDIVIVDDHSGNGRDTWADSKTLYEKLCHLHPEELQSSRSRILVFDYCAVTYPSWNGLEERRKTISEQAQQLLDLMLKQRNTWGTMYRPIIFIAHGLGGLLVEEALKLSIESGYKEFHWIQRVPLISHSTYGVFLFSNKSSLSWKPRGRDQVTAKVLKPIGCSEQNRTDMEAEKTFLKLRCHHHERLQLPSFIQLMRCVTIFSLLFGQTFFAIEATMLVEGLKSRECTIFLLASYILCAVMSYIIRRRDRYQKHIVALGLLIGSIPSSYLIMTGTTFDLIITILTTCVTLSIGISALMHWSLPNHLANEEWKVFHMIEDWAESPSPG